LYPVGRVEGTSSEGNPGTKKRKRHLANLRGGKGLTVPAVFPKRKRGKRSSNDNFGGRRQLYEKGFAKGELQASLPIKLKNPSKKKAKKRTQERKRHGRERARPNARTMEATQLSPWTQRDSHSTEGRQRRRGHPVLHRRSHGWENRLSNSTHDQGEVFHRGAQTKKEKGHKSRISER